MIISNSSLCCKYIDDILSTASRNKDKAIEWDFNFIPPTLSDSRTAYIKDYVKHQDINICFHLPYSFYEVADEDQQIRKTSIDVLKRHIQYAANISASTTDAVLHVGTTASSKLEIACESLEELSLFANSLGVTLCVENLIYGLTSFPDNLKKILLVEGIKFCFDMGHADVVSHKIPNFIDLMAEDIKNCQHVHAYKTEIDFYHVPFDDYNQLISSSLANTVRDSNCKWVTLEIEDLQQQLLQEQFWRTFVKR